MPKTYDKIKLNKIKSLIAEYVLSFASSPNMVRLVFYKYL